MTLVPFLIAATVLAVTPGPGIAYVVARTISGGRAEGLASCIGTGLGGLIHVLASALGVSLIIAQSAIAFSLLKYVGAAYLIYLGVRMWLRPNSPLPTESIDPQGSRRALLEGIVVETLNIKTALFFLAFLPQFVTSDQPLLPQLVTLGCICVALNTLVDVIAVLLAHRLIKSNIVRTPNAKIINYLSGSIMIGLGSLLALVRRDV